MQVLNNKKKTLHGKTFAKHEWPNSSSDFFNKIKSNISFGNMCIRISIVNTLYNSILTILIRIHILPNEILLFILLKNLKKSLAIHVLQRF